MTISLSNQYGRNRIYISSALRTLCPLVLLGLLFAAKDERCASSIILKATPERVRIFPAQQLPVRIEIVNNSKTFIVVAKPMLPNGWTLDRKDPKNGKWQRADSGGILRGEPELGLPHRYTENDYLKLRPGESYVVNVLDGLHSREMEKPLDPGQYRLTFSYSYQPSSDERGLDLLECYLQSDPVYLRVLPK